MPRPKGSINFSRRDFREDFERRWGAPILEIVHDLYKKLGTVPVAEKKLNAILALLPYAYAKLAPLQLPPPMSESEEARSEQEDQQFLENVKNDPDPKHSGAV